MDLYKEIGRKLITTVVGSYPVDSLNYEDALTRAVTNQIDAGIGIISDGQIRANLIDLFVQDIEGIELRGNSLKPRIVGDLAYKYPSTIDDFLKAKKLSEGKCKLAGIITGPTTISYSIDIAPKFSLTKYNSRNYLIGELADILHENAKELERAGADLIQIDEPCFSLLQKGADQKVKFVDRVLEGIKVPTKLHVCGNISKIYKSLLNLENANILDHEFSGNHNNLNTYSEEDLISNEKIIGFGCVNTMRETIESIEDIENFIYKGIEHFGKNIIVDPDCGMRLLPYEIALGKLKNMVLAAKRVEEKLY
ncbi:MAG: methionine synthase [Candidatus Aenigmatarchaeota archaeon]|nr:MAG: methionine synthase [Candidatus Aenigmarchaeota archaeon]